MTDDWYNDPPPTGPLTYPSRRKLTADQVREIRIAAKKGWPYAAIAKRFSVAPASVRAIANRQTYKDVE